MMIFSSFKKGLDQKKKKQKQKPKQKQKKSGARNKQFPALRTVCRALISFELNSLDALWRFRLL